MQKSSKEQLASGQVIVSRIRQNKQTTKQIDVPQWLFDLATHKDEWIFSNVLELQGSKHLKDMSRALFTCLLINLRSKNR